MAIICGGDGGTFSPFMVNGTLYTYQDSTLTTATETSESWGTRAGASELTEGTNVLYMSEQTTPTLTIGGYYNGGRGTVAGLMVFIQEAPTNYAATLEASQNASAISWSPSDPALNGTEAVTLTTADCGLGGHAG